MYYAHSTNPQIAVTTLRADAAKNLEFELEMAADLHGQQSWRIWQAVKLCPVEVLRTLPDRLRKKLDKWIEREVEHFGGERWYVEVALPLLKRPVYANTDDGMRLRTILEKINQANQGKYKGKTGGEEGRVKNEKERDQDAVWLEPLDEATIELADLMVELRKGNRMPAITIHGHSLDEYILTATRKNECNNIFASAVLEAIEVPADLPAVLLVFRFLEANGISSSEPAPKDADEQWERIKAGPKQAESSEDEEEEVKEGSGGFFNQFSLLDVEDGEPSEEDIADAVLNARTMKSDSDDE